ncbi:MAG: hypothetical protein MJZ64_03320 [Paludibacteraceae bacterium]|nr:hypothetical protein [Paludibacteraceae bacterium]
MIESKDIIQIGTLVRTHGKQGEVQGRMLNTYWDEAQAEFIVIMIDNIPVPFRVNEWRCKGDDLLFVLEGVDNEQKALTLTGCDIYMLRSDVVAEEDAILSWQDIVGYSLNGCPVVEIDDSTANVLATLQDGRLIPLHEDLITAIDHTNRTLTMTLPTGL